MLRLTSVAAALFAFSLLAGCGGGSSNSTPPPSAQLSISPTTISFGSAVVGSTGTAKTATLTNTGNASLTITSIVLSDTSNFSMTTGCGASLAASASCTLTFAFTPKSAAALSTTVTISDSSSGSPQTITLTGTGTAGAPQITFTPSAALTFPNTTVGQTSAPQVLTVTNTGNAALTLSVGTLAGASADFTSTTTCGTSLAPSANCTFTFAFTPQATGTLTAAIALTDNASNSPQNITLTGIGTPIPVPQATLAPASITFSPTSIGSTSAALSIALTNTGSAALSISGIVLGGKSPTDFATTNTCPATLAAGLSCQISVTFSPAAVATYSATLTVTDNAGSKAGSTQSVTLQGSGTAAPTPQLTFTPATGLSFTATTVGQTSASQVLTLSNPGNAALNFSYTTTGATVDFTQTPTATPCVTPLAAGSNCTLMFAFTPQAIGPLSEVLTFTDNAATPSQTVTLSGIATAVPTPQGALTPATGLVFPTTAAGTTVALTQVVTLTNTGNATLSISGITLGGANPSDFAETNACPATLAAGSNCQITVSFSPAAAASYTATLIVTDNSGNALVSTQSVPLKGIGSSGPVTVTHKLYVFPESDHSVTQLYALINGAKSTIDMTMYELEDTTFLGDMVAACKNGVTVRVLLDASLEMTNNTPAYNQLNTSGANCSAVFSNTAFQATHQKTIIIDGTTTAIMTLNLQSQYYATSRDFALVENDPADIAAIEETFNEDYAAGTPYGGTQGTSDFADQGGPGDDLIWGPTTATSTPVIPRTAENDMVGIITSATKTLLIENPDMSSSSIVTALKTVCSSKLTPVTVKIVMSEDSTTPPLSPYVSNWLVLEVAGCNIHVYADTTTGLYIHAKAVVADYGLSTQNAYIGSINYSDDSMTKNRELGLYVTDPAAVTLLNTTMSTDYADGIVFQGGIVD